MSIDLDAIRSRLARVAGKWPTKGVLAPGADEFGPKAWSAHGPLRCHSTLKGRARQWTQACADADFIAAAPADIAALLAEIERLREEAHTLRLWTEEAARAENLNAEDAKRERAAVVAWLHDVAERIRRDEYHPSNRENAVLDAADCIERGEHRREGDT